MNLQRTAIALLLTLPIAGACSSEPEAVNQNAEVTTTTTTLSVAVAADAAEVLCGQARMAWNQAQALTRFGSAQYQAAWTDWQAACPDDVPEFLRNR